MYKPQEMQHTTNQYKPDVQQNSPEHIDELMLKRKSDDNLLQNSKIA